MTVLPFALALALWGLALWQGLQPLIDQLHAWFSDYGLFRQSGEILDAMGLSTLRTLLVPLFALIVQPLLWGWLTCRVMAYDALADFADKEELITLRTSQRFPLLVMGVVTGSLGAAPGLLWLGGVVSVIFFPVLAAISIWLYLLIFVFSGLWFQHYCLDALARMRSTFTGSTDPDRVIDAESAHSVPTAAQDKGQQQ